MPTSANLFTAAQLADLVGVHVSRIRSWQRRKWIVPTEVTHRLAYFDFEELTVARQLAKLHRLGISPQSMAKKLVLIERQFPDVQRPLARLNLIFDGRTLLVRRGSELLEPTGQLRIDFDALETEEDDKLPATIPSPAIFLLHSSSSLPEKTAPAQLAAWAVELDEAGDLKSAAEMYRAAMAAGGPHPEWSFHLAEVLYRAGDLGAARERYFSALELDEDYVEARVNLGCVLLELNEKELAVGAFTGALRSHEAYADAHYHLARTFDSLGRQNEAAGHWQRFLDLSPESPWAEEAHLRLHGQA